RLMTEGPRACEHHRHAVFITDFDRLCVSVAAAGLDDRGDAGLAGVFDGVAAREREERVGGQHRACDPLAGALDGLARRPEAVWLAGADADRRSVFGDDNAVGLHLLD